MTKLETKANNLRWILAASVLAVLISAAVLMVRGDTLRHFDEKVYHGLAQTILQGGPYSLGGGAPTAYRPPGYPMFLAIAYSIWPSIYSAKLIQSICVGAIALLIGLLAERARPRSGPIAAGIVAFYPLLQYASTTLYPQTLALMLLLLILYIAFGTRDRWRVAVAGILYGLLILTVPSFMVLLPVVAVLLTWWTAPGESSGTRNVWQRVMLPLLFCVMAAMTVLPWTVRNYLVFGEIIPVSANGGVNLLAGNSPDAGPNTGISVVTPFRSATSEMTEVERDRHFKDQAIAWIKENPEAAATLYVLKFVNYFNFQNELAADSENPGRLGLAAVFISQYTLMLLTAAALLMHRTRPLGDFEKAIIVLFIVNGLISAIFFTRLRFRLPFDGFLIIIAAGVVASLVDARSWRGGPHGNELPSPK